MKAVIQRVSEAKVEVDQKVVATIEKGLLILLGVHEEDDQTDIHWLADKISGLRIFNDESGKLNLNIKQAEGHILVVSQFTLIANTKKGNRPSFIKAALPEKAVLLYESFVQRLQENDIETKEGVFGADMKVSLCNDGPLTFVIDSKARD